MPAPISVPPSWADWTAATRLAKGYAATPPIPNGTHLSAVSFDIDVPGLLEVPFDERWQLQHASLSVDTGIFWANDPSQLNTVYTYWDVPANFQGYLYAGPYFAPRFILASFDNAGAMQFFAPPQSLTIEPTDRIGLRVTGSDIPNNTSSPYYPDLAWISTAGPTGIAYPLHLQLQVQRQKQRS